MCVCGPCSVGSLLPASTPLQTNSSLGQIVPHCWSQGTWSVGSHAHIQSPQENHCRTSTGPPLPRAILWPWRWGMWVMLIPSLITHLHTTYTLTACCRSTFYLRDRIWRQTKRRIKMYACSYLCVQTLCHTFFPYSTDLSRSHELCCSRENHDVNTPHSVIWFIYMTL